MANVFELWAKNPRTKIRKKDWPADGNIYFNGSDIIDAFGFNCSFTEFNLLDDDWEEWKKPRQQTVQQKMDIISSGKLFSISSNGNKFIYRLLKHILYVTTEGGVVCESHIPLSVLLKDTLILEESDES